MYINDALWGDYFSDYRWGIVNCGNYHAGDEVRVRLEITCDELSLYNAYFYEEHIDELAGWSETVRKNEISMEKITSSHYVADNMGTLDDTDGENNSKNRSIVVFSIPYEENWNIRVDGIAVEPVMVYECLMAVPVPRHWEKIDMEY